MKKPFGNTYHGRTVLVTGHTGFKGSWLSIWLRELGAKVVGYSLPDLPSEPSNFTVSNLGEHIVDCRGDIRDLESLQQVVETHQPEIIFHLAARAIAIDGVKYPLDTLTTNAIGTATLLEVIRRQQRPCALISVTTDKVYENREWLWGYRENDRLGGTDPYSASKAMAEAALSAYRGTYFSPETYDAHGVALASTRAGNVIGGGDFGAYRLVPDCMRALLADEPIGIRNPHSKRPWQHVLEPLSGYLWLGAKLLSEGVAYAEAWNFGPLERQGISTRDLAERLIAQWGSGSWVHTEPNMTMVEQTPQMRLSWNKAAMRMGWQPIYTWHDSVTEIVTWFKSYEQGLDMYEVCHEHIETYIERAASLNLPWVEGVG